ncbi:P-protein [Sporotomaculum syntrophicum]|uniref:Prephenate dehydratase n=1 Tax=Sporotomaculum syntrophicum TaxID=182264 RepID=A0A9D3AY11_9FIRM|nr:prephenate dehydratase [Sporotomaculum syntrophicum]KAF1084268.1 P-protein [Sporotomaculum syntrophicum]
MYTLGYLGPQGTFSHTAALHYAGRHGYTPVCCSSLDAVMQKLASQKLTCGIVPVENSLGGSVGETLDLLTRAEGIWVTAEFLLPVKQHLLARPGVVLADISKVYSHPQALAQCRSFLKQQLPNTPVVETVSTASAALMVAGAEAATAAVGSQSAAVTYGLQILYADIQDKADNTTRFWVLGREKPSFSGKAKTSLVLALQDSPGALCRILSPLAQRGINLTRIESRPSGSKLGEYIFFIDFEGHSNNREVCDAVRELRENTFWLKMLGCYPVATGDGDMPSRWEPVQPVGLPGLRKEIDKIDDNILRLLTRRQELVEQVAAFKSKDMVVDSSREEEILCRVKEMACQSGIDPDIVEGIYRQIFIGAVRRQVDLLASCGN